jgi:hypothetical protein
MPHPATGPVGGVPLTAIEPRITAAIFGGGFLVYEALIEAARPITAGRYVTGLT